MLAAKDVAIQLLAFKVKALIFDLEKTGVLLTCKSTKALVDEDIASAKNLLETLKKENLL